MIKVKKISKIFANGHRALENIDFMVNKGEFVYVVGPSGSGKSTLLNCIFRKEIPTAGSIYIDNYSLTQLSSRQISFLRRNMGMIFQDFKLLQTRNVFDNIAFALHIFGYSRASIRRSVNQVLELVGLDDKAAYLPSELSGGEQQRICIARAIVNNPPILLADEPTGSLDINTAKELFKLLKNQLNSERLIIFATHNRFFANKADCLLEMVNGNIKTINA